MLNWEELKTLREFECAVHEAELGAWKGEKYIWLELGTLDGGEFGRDIHDWRKLSLEKARTLRDNLNTAIEELESLNPAP